MPRVLKLRSTGKVERPVPALVEGGYFWVFYSDEWDVARYIGGPDEVFWLASFSPGVVAKEHIDRIGPFIGVMPPEAQQ